MNRGKITFRQGIFEVEIAQTISEKTRGLSGREYLHDNHGMLFVFTFESIYPFTMRGMLFPIDIIWLDRFEKIVHITENAKPCRQLLCAPINPWKKAKYVLEVNAGTAKKMRLKVGDRAEIHLV